MRSKEAHKDEVVKEFPPVGKYRVRLLRGEPGSVSEKILDIREYVSSQDFEGFTRRGIRLGARAQVEQLRDVLLELLEDQLI
jgi:hypothetical protein